MDNRAVVISIDAMTLRDLGELGKRRNISTLLSSSSMVERITEVYPTYTYPCHAAVITGCYPEKNGIYHNEIPSPFDNRNEWFWWEKYLKRKTIIDVANENGLVTSSVAWPVLAGGRAVYSIPEIWPTENTKDVEAMYREAVSAPAWPVFEKNRAFLEERDKPFYDLYTVSSSEDIIREHRPDLMLIHISELDHRKHAQGSDIRKLDKTYDFLDECIGRIIKALRDASIYDETTFFLLGDHGHMDINRVFAVNRVLCDMGYITEKDGKVTSYRIYCHPSAFSSEVLLDGIKEDEAVDVFRKIQSLYPGTIERILTKKETQERYHLSGPFSIVIEGEDNLIFSPRTDIPYLMEREEADKYKIQFSTHGYTPEKGEKPPFVVCGRRANRNRVIEKGRLVDEGPTILSLFSLELDGDIDGRVIKGLLS